ncbi:MAG TPA: iron-sulfur cluster-binding domain-containing protein [Puia sp.]|nr:iron-sulfur cluster-binding domain-containing protein [Puia sp.]
MENWIWRVTAILPETADMKTIFLERRSGEPVPYQAGQFLTLLFDVHGRELRRSYSFSSAPSMDAGPAITVKRVVNGEISRRLLDHLQVGDVVVSLPPAGRFTLDVDADFHVFIAAGSGLVPVFSLLKELRTTRPRAAALLLTQQHDEGSTPFRSALTGMGVDWTDVLTVRDGKLTKDRLIRWMRKAGVAGSSKSRNDAGVAVDARFYLCGPPDFMRWVQIVLRTMGIADDRVRREHFTVGTIPPAPPVFDASPKKVVVRAAIDREFVVTWPESILTAAIRQGIPLPYSCRAGRCSSCVAHCVRGRVQMSNNEVLTERDLAAGLVLTCVGYAETDVELDYAMSPASNARGSSVPDRGTI